MNAFTTPSNEPPPAYTASPTIANNAPLFDVPAAAATVPVPSPTATRKFTFTSTISIS